MQLYRARLVENHTPVFKAELMHNLFHLVHLLIRGCGTLVSIQSAYVISKGKKYRMEA